jgi:hypothetical protein
MVDCAAKTGHTIEHKIAYLYQDFLVEHCLYLISTGPDNKWLAQFQWGDNTGGIH